MADIQVTQADIDAITDEAVEARKLHMRSLKIPEDIIARITKEYIAKENITAQRIRADIDKIVEIAKVNREVAATAYLEVNMMSVDDAVALINKNKGSTGGKRKYRKSTRRSKKHRSTRRR
jgi:hypothetical protein